MSGGKNTTWLVWGKVKKSTKLNVSTIYTTHGCLKYASPNTRKSLKIRYKISLCSVYICQVRLNN
jgi:hypothetical protein